jgi:hypothetical protein
MALGKKLENSATTAKTLDYHLLFNHYKRQSIYRKKSFALDLKEFSAMAASPCFYCGGLPQTIFVGKIIHNGIDRLDNTVGYTVENCVPACKHCNRAKGTLSLSEFKDWIDRVVKASGHS